MVILNNISDLESFQNAHLGLKLAFVPTMGALHQGHLSLIREAKIHSDKVLVSIFVNPLQFNNPEDFEKYPITLQADLELLSKENCDAVYIPNKNEIYPENFQPIYLDISSLSDKLEGVFRPGHFDGVVQVLYRFFDLIKPDLALFGLKDYQQCLVVKLLADAYFPDLKLYFLPTLREKSGLAMSSRNARLSLKAKTLASEIYQSLVWARKLKEENTPQELNLKVRERMEKRGIEVEYVAVVESETMNECTVWDSEKKYLILTAVWIDGVRLIDNLFLE